MGSVVKSAVKIGSLGLIDGDDAFPGADAAEDAAAATSAAAMADVEEQRRQFDITQENMQPYLGTGRRALSQQERLLGLRGEWNQQQMFDKFNSSPGQEFLRDRGERALLRNSAAIGGLGGGNVRSALQQEGIGFAQQDFANQYNRLAGLSNTGQTATSNLGQLGAQSAANISSGLQSAGESRASGILGAAQADSQIVNDVTSFASMFI